MIKNTIINLALIASSVSFSFYPMEEHYLLGAKHDDPFYAHEYTLCVRDQNTSLRISYTFDNDVNLILDRWTKHHDIKDIETYPQNFIRCLFNYDDKFWDIFKEKDSHILLPYAIYSLLPRDIRSNGYSIIKQNINSSIREYESEINMRPVFKSRSGVEIDNTGKEVVLRRGKKTIALKGALQQHFDRNRVTTEFATELIKYRKIINSSLSEQEIDDYCAKHFEPILEHYDKLLPDENFKLLNESQILAIWCLIPNKIKVKGEYKSVESQLVGLAKGKGGKLFHCAIDLNNDISVLFPKQEENFITFEIFRTFLP